MFIRCEHGSDSSGTMLPPFIRTLMGCFWLSRSLLQDVSGGMAAHDACAVSNTRAQLFRWPLLPSVVRAARMVRSPSPPYCCGGRPALAGVAAAVVEVK